MTPLASRKQILIAASELNRAHMVHDWQKVADELHALAAEARTVRSFAAATTTLVAGVAGFWRRKLPPRTAAPPRWQVILKSAGTLASLWQAFRAPRPRSDRDDS